MTVEATGIPALDIALVWGGAATILASVATALWRAVRGTVQLAGRVDEFMADWSGEPERPGVPGRPRVMERVAAIEERLQRVEHELYADSGGSLRDAVDQANEGLARLCPEPEDCGPAPTPARYAAGVSTGCSLMGCPPHGTGAGSLAFLPSSRSMMGMSSPLPGDICAYGRREDCRYAQPQSPVRRNQPDRTSPRCCQAQGFRARLVPGPGPYRLLRPRTPLLACWRKTLRPRHPTGASSPYARDRRRSTTRSSGRTRRCDSPRPGGTSAVGCTRSARRGRRDVSAHPGRSHQRARPATDR